MTLRPTFLVLAVALCCFNTRAQSAQQLLVNPAGSKIVRENSALPNLDGTAPKSTETAAGGIEKAAAGKTDSAKPPEPQFRVERIPVAGGAELLTVFGRLDGLRNQDGSAPELPLISVVRDSLNDADPDNDRLRYVWVLTYTRPNLTKRIASAIPFLYQHIGNQREAANQPPKAILDLANPAQRTWNHFFWTAMQDIFLDSWGIPLKASTRTYRQNASDYRSGHVLQALSIFDTYVTLQQRSRDQNELLALGDNNKAGTDSVSDASPSLFPSSVFTPGEMLEMRARLILSTKTFGGLLGPDKFDTTVTKRIMASVDNSGHNWEMLRQRAEAEGLYFEPLTMPDGRATHAIIWVAKPDLTSQANREFHDRFLNIADPWSDSRLRNWSGYSRSFFFNNDGRIVDSGAPDAHRVEMIPLALYGLDHPKIPALLIDFRDNLNPKKREMSRRVFTDLAKNVFSLSGFGNLPYFVGKHAYDFVTGRRGMDLNQPTRLRGYSELKLLLSFNSSIDSRLRQEIARRIQNVSLNPLNNDNEAELALAQQQYSALLDYAHRPDGLPAKIERDRRAEMVPLKHGPTARFFYSLGNVLTFGRYIHREDATPDLEARLQLARRVERHTQFLNEVARSSPQTEVAWDISTVRQSLRFLVDEPAEAKGSAAKAAAAIFGKTNDDETRRLCLEALSKINNRTARAELLRIYRQQAPQSELRSELAERLRKAVTDDARIKPSEARSLLSQVGTP